MIIVYHCCQIVFILANERESTRIPSPRMEIYTFQHIDPSLNQFFSWCIYLNIRQVRVQVVGTGTHGSHGGVRSHQAESSSERDAVPKDSPFLQVKPQGFTDQISISTVEI